MEGEQCDERGKLYTNNGGDGIRLTMKALCQGFRNGEGRSLSLSHSFSLSHTHFLSDVGEKRAYKSFTGLIAVICGRGESRIRG